MRKYILHPGKIISESDGQEHEISAVQLVEIYGVSLNDCIVVDYRRPESFMGLDPSKWIHLYPQYHYNDYLTIKKTLTP